MLGSIRRFLGRFSTLNSMLGEVVFETPEISGQTPFSMFQWRLKEGVDDRVFYISLKLRPDFYGGWKGAEKHYIAFDIAAAERIRADLDSCLAEYRRLAEAGPNAAPATPTVTRD